MKVQGGPTKRSVVFFVGGFILVRVGREPLPLDGFIVPDRLGDGWMLFPEPALLGVERSAVGSIGGVVVAASLQNPSCGELGH